MRIVCLFSLSLVVGCSPPAVPGAGDGSDTGSSSGADCGFGYPDEDGDGYGVLAEGYGWICGDRTGLADNPRDCDDTDPDVFPEGRWETPMQVIADRSTEDLGLYEYTEVPEEFAEGCYAVVAESVYLEGGGAEMLEPFRSVRAFRGGLDMMEIDVVELDALAGVEVVDEDLILQQFPELRSLDGLVALEEVEGSLSVSANPQLVGMEGLRSLRSAQRLVWGGNNQDAVPIDLSSREQPLAVNYLSIADDGLTSLDGLLLPAKPEYLSLGGAALVDLGALSTVEEVELGLKLRDVPVADLEDLSGLRRVFALDLNGLPNLTDLDGLRGLLEVENFVVLIDNPELSSLEGLHSLSYVSGVYLHSNPKISEAEIDALREALGDALQGEIYVDYDGG